MSNTEATIQIKRLRDGYRMPCRATSGSAAYDVYAPGPVKIHYGRQVIPLGFALSMPVILGSDCRTRAGYASKGLAVLNAKGEVVRINADVILGLIDSDYRDEVGVILNVRDWRVLFRDYFINPDKPLAQLSFFLVPDTLLEEVQDFSEGDRITERIGGFGKQNGE